MLKQQMITRLPTTKKYTKQTFIKWFKSKKTNLLESKYINVLKLIFVNANLVVIATPYLKVITKHATNYYDNSEIKKLLLLNVDINTLIDEFQKILYGFEYLLMPYLHFIFYKSSHDKKIITLKEHGQNQWKSVESHDNIITKSISLPFLDLLQNLKQKYKDYKNAVEMTVSSRYWYKTDFNALHEFTIEINVQQELLSFQNIKLEIFDKYYKHTARKLVEHCFKTKKYTFISSSDLQLSFIQLVRELSQRNFYV